MKERAPNKAEVYRMPTRVHLLSEISKSVIGVYDAVDVGVELDGKRVWNKLVTPFFAFPLEIMYVPKPFYSKRIRSAIRKAEKIASELNRPSKYEDTPRV